MPERGLTFSKGPSEPLTFLQTPQAAFTNVPRGNRQRLAISDRRPALSAAFITGKDCGNTWKGPNPPYADVMGHLEHAWGPGFRLVVFPLPPSFPHTADRFDRLHRKGRLRRVHASPRLQDTCVVRAALLAGDLRLEPGSSTGPRDGAHRSASTRCPPAPAARMTEYGRPVASQMLNGAANEALLSADMLATARRYSGERAALLTVRGELCRRKFRILARVLRPVDQNPTVQDFPISGPSNWPVF